MPITTIIIYVASMLVFALILNLGGWWATLKIFDKLAKGLKFEPFVAVRHLRGRKSGFLTAIGVLSILGVSFSSCTLTTVLSVMGGFSGDLKDKILKTNAHIVVDNYGADMNDWRSVLDSVRKVEGVKAATPIIQGEMMVNARTNTHGILLKGIDLDSFTKVSGVFDVLERGNVDFLQRPEALFEEVRKKRLKLYGDDAKQRDGPDGGVQEEKEEEKKPVAAPVPAVPRQKVLPAVIVGREASRSLRLYVGEEVNIINPIGGIGPTGPIPKSRPFRVGGVFFSGMYEFDSLFVYMTIEAAQEFMSKKGVISEIHISVDDPDDAQKIAGRINKALGGKWRVRSWADLNAALFSALKLEKIVMFIFLSMAILVASFCIVATLTMLVLEKGAEVSVMMTLGASSKEVQSIFRFEGLLIGLVGTVSGLLVGFGLCMTLDKIGLPIDPEVWYIDTLPIRMEWVEFLAVGLASMIITQLATLYPTHAAARLTPVEGLKNG